MEQTHNKDPAKRKGKINDPNSYRWITLENKSFKILTIILVNKITQEVNTKISEEQFGFRSGRDTIQAIENLTKYIEESLRHKKAKVNAVFIYFTKPFDLIDRQMLINKLQQMTNNNMTKTVKNILAYNIVIIDNTQCQQKK